MAATHAHRWSLAFGHWWGIPVRLHLLMLLFAVLAVGVTLDGSVSEGVLTAVVLLASVALHEAAHSVAAIRFGGQVDGVVLAPIGGLRAPRVPNEPEPQLFVAASGPIANLTVVAAATIALVALDTPPAGLLPLLNPVGPTGLLEGSLQLIALKEALWINWSLFLINLLPVYPFDGGPALRAMLWPLVGRRTAAVATAYTAQASAAALCVLAIGIEKANPQALMPLWAPLVTLAVFVFFSAQRDLLLVSAPIEEDSDPRRYPREATGHELFSSDWADDGDEMVLVEHGSEGRREHRRRKQEADEAYEDARVDDILARLHDVGFDRLSAEERAILQRASQRYRNRQGADDDRADRATSGPR